VQWEHLTSAEFPNAVERCNRVGILPIGVVEAHGAHLPLGQDMLTAHAIACRAADVEAAVVFPAYPWGINHESAHLAGAVALSRATVMKMLEEVCDEMARNGITKIIIYSGHGGNRFLVNLFVQTFVEKPRDYCVYAADVPFFSERTQTLMETKELGHACEGETSVALYLHGQLVKMDALPDAFSSLRRNADLAAARVYSPVDWYAMYPRMYVGDARKANPDKGKAMVDDIVAGLVAAIRAVKKDTVTQKLLVEVVRAREEPEPPFPAAADRRVGFNPTA